jgi:hypothetical protein
VSSSSEPKPRTRAEVVREAKIPERKRNARAGSNLRVCGPQRNGAAFALGTRFGCTCHSENMGGRRLKEEFPPRGHLGAASAPCRRRRVAVVEISSPCSSCTAKVQRLLSQPFYAAKTAKRFVFGAVKSLFASRNLRLAIRLCTYTSILDDDAMRRIRARQPYSRELGRLRGVWHSPFLTGARVQAVAAPHKLSIVAFWGKGGTDGLSCFGRPREGFPRCGQKVGTETEICPRKLFNLNRLALWQDRMGKTGRATS